MEKHVSGAFEAQRQEKHGRANPVWLRCCACGDRNHHVESRVILGEIVNCCFNCAGTKIHKFVADRQAETAKIRAAKEFSGPVVIPKATPITVPEKGTVSDAAGFLKKYTAIHAFEDFPPKKPVKVLSRDAVRTLFVGWGGPPVPVEKKAPLGDILKRLFETFKPVLFTSDEHWLMNTRTSWEEHRRQLRNRVLQNEFCIGIDFNRSHPEIQEGEQFLSNTLSGEDYFKKIPS